MLPVGSCGSSIRISKGTVHSVSGNLNVDAVD